MNILAIGDTHIPFEIKHYMEFCLETKKKYKCDTIVHIGDLLEHNSNSYHERSPNGYGPLEELKRARQTISKWKQAFPEMYICKGNHDVLIDRQAITYGFPEPHIRGIAEVYGFSPKWVYDWKHHFCGVCFEHGTGNGGQYPHVNLAKNNRCKTVIGHCHSVAGSQYLANDKDVIWGLAVGCGIDRMKYPFWYGKDFKQKPVIGCGVVLEAGKEAHFVPMRGVK